MMRYSYCERKMNDGDRTYLGEGNGLYHSGYKNDGTVEVDTLDDASDLVETDDREDKKTTKVLTAVALIVALITVISTFALSDTGKLTKILDNLHKGVDIERADYIFPDSATVLLTESDLKGKSAWELTIARNEIVARHGYTFKRQDLQDYFNSKSWYYAVGQFDLGTKLSTTEMKNMTFINRYQKEHNLQD